MIKKHNDFLQDLISLFEKYSLNLYLINGSGGTTSLEIVSDGVFSSITEIDLDYELVCIGSDNGKLSISKHEKE